MQSEECREKVCCSSHAKTPEVVQLPEVPTDISVRTKYFLFLDLPFFSWGGGGAEGIPDSKAVFSFVFLLKMRLNCLGWYIFSIYYVVTNFFPQPLRSDF